ncbi:hypothetical protein LJY25_13100 [Hymenobacter sp. BT175]|uniref:hypothetical protein n=1 Tax=Hymenobacter translucens TaxID=2886507 RepID=UPI001D0EC7F8|nr:hypothetical protein [Hymenobacter translucens]MCC2547386.1 hypothetical protein [Hymenobacter translucens]
MPINVSLLLTRAECDEVTKELDKRLNRLDIREQNYDYQKEIGTERATDLSEEKTGLNQRITFLSGYLLTLTAGTDEHEKTTDDLRKSNARLGEVEALMRKEGGAKAVLGQSILKETQGRSTSIEEDKADVVAHRATLTA